LRYEFKESNEILDIVKKANEYVYTIRIFKNSNDYVGLIVERLNKPVKVLYGRFSHDKIIMMLNENGFEKTFLAIEKELMKRARK
jgi:hypothetical protein